MIWFGNRVWDQLLEGCSPVAFVSGEWGEGREGVKVLMCVSLGLKSLQSLL